MDASVYAPSAATGATAEEQDKAEDAGTIAAPARSGATTLARTAGRTSLVRAPGGINLARTALRATPVFLLCLHHQEGTMTTNRTKEPGASRSHAPSPASWVALRP